MKLKKKFMYFELPDEGAVYIPLKDGAVDGMIREREKEENLGLFLEGMDKIMESKHAFFSKKKEGIADTVPEYDFGGFNLGVSYKYEKENRDKIMEKIRNYITAEGFPILEDGSVYIPVGKEAKNTLDGQSGPEYRSFNYDKIPNWFKGLKLEGHIPTHKPQHDLFGSAGIKYHTPLSIKNRTDGAA